MAGHGHAGAKAEGRALPEAAEERPALTGDVDERSEAKYLTILAVALLLGGLWLGWATHRIWLDGFEPARRATGIQAIGHAVRALVPFLLLAGALWVLPRRRDVVTALGIAAAVLTAIGAFGYRSALRSDGRPWAEPSLGPPQTTWQWWVAVLGSVAGATISRWQHPDARRP